MKERKSETCLHGGTNSQKRTAFYPRKMKCKHSISIFCIVIYNICRLKVKSDNLEQLVNTEVGDIDNILHTINSLQGTQL